MRIACASLSLSFPLSLSCTATFDERRRLLIERLSAGSIQTWSQIASRTYTIETNTQRCLGASNVAKIRFRGCWHLRLLHSLSFLLFFYISVSLFYPWMTNKNQDSFNPRCAYPIVRADPYSIEGDHWLGSHKRNLWKKPYAVENIGKKTTYVKNNRCQAAEEVLFSI